MEVILAAFLENTRFLSPPVALKLSSTKVWTIMDKRCNWLKFSLGMLVRARLPRWIGGPTEKSSRPRKQKIEEIVGGIYVGKVKILA